MRALCGFVAYRYVPDFYKEIGDFFVGRKIFRPYQGRSLVVARRRRLVLC